MKGIKTVPARSANFQPMAPFQHGMLSSNPLGIPTRSDPFQSLVTQMTYLFIVLKTQTHPILDRFAVQERSKSNNASSI
jgi:hypothetical protein